MIQEAFENIYGNKPQNVSGGTEPQRFLLQDVCLVTEGLPTSTEFCTGRWGPGCRWGSGRAQLVVGQKMVKLRGAQ